jgi:hypothetical protein
VLGNSELFFGKYSLFERNGKKEESERHKSVVFTAICWLMSAIEWNLGIFKRKGQIGFVFDWLIFVFEVITFTRS